MMLVEEGKVALDTPVHHVLPEFKDIGVYNGGGAGVPFQTRPTSEPMRMIDLLRHTSGLTYGFQNRSNVDAAYREGRIENWHGGLDLDGFVAALGRLPLEFSPGTAWNYSVSTDVLGAVVERVSGLSLPDFFATRIFAPLGMLDTFFHVPAGKIDRLTDCYTLPPGKGRVLYDRGVYLYAMGYTGPLNDDMGRSVCNYIKRKLGGFTPRRILDMGCTVGHSTLPYKELFPEAEVWGIDVAGPQMRYAHARAAGLGREVNFAQMNAEATSFPDGYFDLVVSHILLHETSGKAMPKIFEECARVLSPGGYMIHADLPPFDLMDPFTQFILDNET
eukprot:gene31703-36318_t